MSDQKNEKLQCMYCRAPGAEICLTCQAGLDNGVREPVQVSEGVWRLMVSGYSDDERAGQPRQTGV